MWRQRKIFKRILQNLSSALICQPVHFDWEHLYRLNEGNLSILECWKRSKYLLLGYNILFFLEHMVLFVPMVLLKIAIVQRNQLLERDFPLTEDELHSTQVVDSHFFSACVLFFVSPFLCYFLSYIYWRKKHAWSRILDSAILQKVTS